MLARRSYARVPHSHVESREKCILTAPHRTRVTAAKDRSVWCAPPTGWVTVLAGLLAHGSSLAPGLPSFPVAIADAGSPLTVAGAATDICWCKLPCSLLPPRLSPGNQHGRNITWARARSQGVQSQKRLNNPQKRWLLHQISASASRVACHARVLVDECHHPAFIRNRRMSSRIPISAPPK